MQKKMDKESFKKVSKALGFVQAAIAYFDILEDGIMEEFTFDQWKEIRLNLCFPTLPMEKNLIVLQKMKETAKNIDELFMTLRLSHYEEDLSREIKALLSEKGTEEEWLEIFRSVDSNLDSREIKDFVVERVRLIYLPQ